MKMKKNVINEVGLTLQVVLYVATDNPKIPTLEEFQTWAGAALTDLAKDALELCIRIVDPEESARLNHQYRGKNKPTNVLSFDYGKDETDEALRLLGDLVICADVVAQEAKEQNKTAAAHWAHMTVHGVLHLLGYDHQDDEAADKMEALETKILKQLGFADPYQIN